MYPKFVPGFLLYGSFSSRGLVKNFSVSLKILSTRDLK